jgi:hypothetical protein
VSFVRALERYAARSPAHFAERDAKERCEVCAAEIAPAHPHLFETSRRALLCACPACATLFGDRGAGAGRYRRVPDRVLVDPGARIDDEAWTKAGVPVGLAFVVCNAERTEAVAFYPSPAGPVQSSLAPEAWSTLLESTSLAREMEPDVEALLVRRARSGAFDCMLAPVDVCFALVGEVRMRWRGFDGGDDARGAIDAVFSSLHQRARPHATASGRGGTP